MSYTDEDIEQLIDKTVDKVDKKLAERDARWDKRMAKRDAKWDKKVNEATERAAGAVYEKLEHQFALVHEATDFIKGRLDEMPTRDEFEEVKADISTIKLAVKHTNQDFKRWYED